MVKVGANKATKEEADLGPMKEEKRLFYFLFYTRNVTPSKFQAKEEIIGFCQVNPCICLLPSWGGCVVCDVRGGRGEDLHVHGGASQLVGGIFTLKKYMLSNFLTKVPFEEEAYLAKQKEAKVVLLPS